MVDKKQKVAFGVIGSGRIGRIHTENLCRIPGAHVLAVADSIPDVAKTCAAACGISCASSDYREILENPRIEAVVICTSTDSHAAIIQDAAAAKKHIFCEKPIALEMSAIDAALAAVSAHGVKLQIGFQRRFDPSFRRARELVAAGEAGNVLVLRITSRDPEPPSLDYVKKSGGIFLDMTIHDFDMARFLLQSEVEEIQACGSVSIEPAIGALGDFDTAVSVIKFRNGAICVIDNCRKSAYGYDQRVEIFGSRGMINVGNCLPDTTLISDTKGIHQPLPPHFFIERYQQAYLDEMKSFVDCILLNRQPEVTGEDGRAPVLMAYAAMRSAAEKRPVRISEILHNPTASSLREISQGKEKL